MYLGTITTPPHISIVPLESAFAQHVFLCPGPRGQKDPREMLSFAVVAGALLQGLGSAAPPRAPARGGIKLSSCPKGGSSPAAAHDDSETGIETFARDYEISTPYENGGTCGAHLLQREHTEAQSLDHDRLHHHAVQSGDCLGL